MAYSPERKAAVLTKMLPPNNMPLGQLAKEEGISEATLYNWRSRYSGLQVSDAKRLRSLEDESRKLKKLLAEAMLDNAALKDIASGKF